MKKALLILSLILLLISCSNNAVYEKLFSETNKGIKITNYKELQDFFSKNNQEPEGYVANDISLDISQKVIIESQIDKTLYLNGNTITGSD